MCRHVVRPRLAATPGPQEARTDFERAARIFLKPPPFCLTLRDPRVDWVSVGAPDPHRVMLYFHGGAYFAGSPETHRGLTGHLAALSSLRVAVPRYPLAPEFPAPAAFDAAVAVYDDIARLGYAPHQIVLGGDSAGGGLALALLARLTQIGRTPAGLFAFSPWTDLTGSGDTIDQNANADVLFERSRLKEVVGYVTAQGGLSPEDPRLSPLFAEFKAPCPVWLSAAKTEILLDDTRRMRDVLEQAGGTVTTCFLSDAPHVWPIAEGFFPEALETTALAAAFAREVLKLPPKRPI